MTKDIKRDNLVSPPMNVHFALSEKFGGPADADWVQGDNSYTVTQNGITIGTHVSYNDVKKAEAFLNAGKEGSAHMKLSPFR